MEVLGGALVEGRASWASGLWVQGISLGTQAPSASIKRSPGAPWHFQAASLAPEKHWDVLGWPAEAGAEKHFCRHGDEGRGAHRHSRSAWRTDFITAEKGLCGGVGRGCPLPGTLGLPSEGAGA